MVTGISKYNKNIFEFKVNFTKLKNTERKEKKDTLGHVSLVL